MFTLIVYKYYSFVKNILLEDYNINTTFLFDNNKFRFLRYNLFSLIQSLINLSGIIIISIDYIKTLIYIIKNRSELNFF